MRRLIASVLVFAFITSAPFGSSAPDQKHVDKIKRKVASCVENSRHVSVETYDGRELQGSISEANSDTFVLSFHNNSTTLNLCRREDNQMALGAVEGGEDRHRRNCCDRRPVLGRSSSRRPARLTKIDAFQLNLQLPVADN